MTVQQAGRFVDITHYWEFAFLFLFRPDALHMRQRF